MNETTPQFTIDRTVDGPSFISTIALPREATTPPLDSRWMGNKFKHIVTRQLAVACRWPEIPELCKKDEQHKGCT
jgi:hypothetical protein